MSNRNKLSSDRFESIPVTTVKEACEMMRRGYWLLTPQPAMHWYILEKSVVCVQTPFSSYGCGISRISAALQSQKMLLATRRKDLASE